MNRTRKRAQSQKKPQKLVEAYIIILYGLGLSKSKIARMLTTEKRIIRTHIQELQKQGKLKVRPQNWRKGHTLRATVYFAAQNLSTQGGVRPEVMKVLKLINDHELSPLKGLKQILEGMLSLETGLVLLQNRQESSSEIDIPKELSRTKVVVDKETVIDCWHQFLYDITEEHIRLPHTVEGIKHVLHVWFLTTLNESITF
ncbi:MAG: hypothetical protein CL685_01785 [Candidatus Magasanikbacteria bacterium]|nr:hypothetical protein [Candidatus Magasanikbacteria bacterium]|tara:strand:- start:1996 stop:2595 length:600 start_codon:yes stop_codon:yes gene_type:complete